MPNSVFWIPKQEGSEQELFFDALEFSNLSEAEQKQHLRSIVEELTQAKRPTFFKLYKPNIITDETINSLATLFEQYPWLMVADDTNFDEVLINKTTKLRRLAARNAYIWFANPELITEEGRSFSKVDWWEKAATIWLNQLNLKEIHTHTSYYFKETSPLGAEYYSDSMRIGLHNLCIEEMGGLFLNAILKEIAVNKTKIGQSFVINADFSNTHGNIFKGHYGDAHIALDYMDALLAHIHEMPFQTVHLEGVHFASNNNKGKTLVKENKSHFEKEKAQRYITGQNEEFNSCGPLAASHFYSAITQQNRNTVEKSLYQTEFFNKFKQILINAPAELETIYVQGIETDSEPDYFGEVYRIYPDIFTENQLEELLALAEAGK